MTELTLEPTETVRARVERALASEEVNLVSEAGRGRTEELIEETLRSYEAEALSGQSPPLDPQRKVLEQDCTQPIVDWSANLKCR